MSMRAVCSLAAVIGAGDRVHYESFAHFGLPEVARLVREVVPLEAREEARADGDGRRDFHRVAS